MHTGTRNKGFTLIELIVVLMILVIGAVFGLSSLRGFSRNAEQNARNDVARAIFMAAQTALTQRYNQDSEFAQTGYKGTTLPSEAQTALVLPAEQQRAQAGRIIYMVSSAANPSAELLGWLSPQMNDKSVLSNSILIEYDKETGRMLSAFYSEKKVSGNAVTLGYNGSAYNVCNRSAEQLAAGFVGYYGVDDTGEVIRSEAPDETLFDVMLVDYVNRDTSSGDPSIRPYGVLTAEVLLPNDSNLRDDSYIYTLELMDAEGGKETVIFAENDQTEMPSGVTADFYLADITATDIDVAIAHPTALHGHGDRPVAVFIEPATNKDPSSATSAQCNRIVFVLDGVQSLSASYTWENSISVRRAYPNLKNGELLASLTIDDGANSTTEFSDTGSRPIVQVLYGGSNNDEIQSVRHLSNLRYNTDENVTFHQTQNLYLQDYDLNRLNFMPIGNPYDAQITNEPLPGFVGKFDNNDWNIYDLYVKLDVAAAAMPDMKNAGLFDTIRAGSVVEKLRLYSEFEVTRLLHPMRLVLPTNTTGGNRTADVSGIAAAGGIAGINHGTIRECTVLGRIVAQNENGESIAGGIAGGLGQGGKIINCFTAAEVRAGKYAGGIAGSSQGMIDQCEAGTASFRDPNDNVNLYLSGVPYYGAHAAGTQATYLPVPATANNTFCVINEKSGGAAGGIVGAMSSSGTVATCVNACKVESGNSNTQLGNHYNGIAGGIAGVVDSSANATMRACYNAGAIYGSEVAGGVVGKLIEGKISNCYNTGYVNREFVRKQINGDDYYLPGEPRNIGDATDHKSGGLVGYGSGADIYITDCYSAQYAGGKYGGAFGVMNRTAVDTDGHIVNCCFLQNVLNDSREFNWEHGSTVELVPEIDNPLKMLTRKNLVKAPADENLSSGVYEAGTLTNAWFGFKYPILKNLTGVDKSHRTPFNDVVENYGWVRLDVNNLNPEGLLKVEFNVTPDELALLEFEVTTGGAAGTEKTFYVPIGKYQYSDEWNFMELRNIADRDPRGIEYGYTTFPPATRPASVERDYTLGIKAYSVTENSSYGYNGYRYVISFNTGATDLDDDLHGSIIPTMEGNFVRIRVWLYNGEKWPTIYEQTDAVDFAEWERIATNQIRLNVGNYYDTPTNNVSAQELCYKRANTALKPETAIRFVYAGKPEQRITVKELDWNNAQTSLKDAIEEFEDNGLGLQFDTETQPRFPYYVDPSGELHVVLWYFDGQDIHQRRRPNGLQVDTRVTVRVENSAETLERWFEDLG